jgi:hypothetical protein
MKPAALPAVNGKWRLRVASMPQSKRRPVPLWDRFGGKVQPACNT